MPIRGDDEELWKRLAYVNWLANGIACVGLPKSHCAIQRAACETFTEVNIVDEIDGRHSAFVAIRRSFDDAAVICIPYPDTPILTTTH